MLEIIVMAMEELTRDMENFTCVSKALDFGMNFFSLFATKLLFTLFDFFTGFPFLTPASYLQNHYKK